MLNPIQQLCAGYWDELPSNIVKNASQSAIYSFAVNVLWSQRGWEKIYLYLKDPVSRFNVLDPFTTAGIAAFSALIYSFATPIFNRIFGDNKVVIYREMMKELVCVISSSVLVSYALASRVNFSAFVIFRFISSNVCKAYLDFIPTLLNAINDSTRLKVIREFYDTLGIQAVPGSSSIFLVW